MNNKKKETILVVEDEPFVQMFLKDLLNELGHDVLVANDAPSALRILKGDSPIDLLLTDVGLPGKSGRELADEARQLRADLPILFATGYGDRQEELSRSFARRAAVVAKPFDLQRLASALQSLLEPS
jgi:CheY-like chemotaxis protein